MRTRLAAMRGSRAAARVMWVITLALISGAADRSAAGAEMLFNPGFENLNPLEDSTYGDGWGKFGNTDFNAFFGAGNGHASLFADTIGNSGGVYQQGIVGTPGVQYQFTLTDTLIEANWNATLQFGLEYYAGDDSTKLGETIVTIDTSLPENHGGGLIFSMNGTAVASTAFVRPIIKFGDVLSSGGSSRNTFVFEASLQALPEPTGFGLMTIASMSLVASRRRQRRDA